MIRALQLMICLSFCSLSAHSVQNNQTTYQIDVIVFVQTHHFAMDSNKTSVILTQETSKHSNATIIVPHPSSLSRELNLIKQQPQYLTLFHISWLQPGNHQQAVHLVVQSADGWHVEGNIRVRQSNYYLLDSKLSFSTRGQAPFIITQKQRLKPGKTYYLDHPKAGMLIKVHRLN